MEDVLIGPLHEGRCIVLEVPLRNLLTSICNFLPCNRVVQRAYSGGTDSQILIAENLNVDIP